ncbi:hypothetical protein TWF696_000709 [Orbilia brochopaga]|uniref:Uncharacterized protein n=1 Tax=Orbilia brochopaga TaxID=3140254 RepID=A0AAV9VF45_9PEZI
MATASTRAAAHNDASATTNDAVPTVEITAGSSIKSKVRQCLAILQVPSGAPSTQSAASGKTLRKAKGGNRIVALKAVHPSAGSKAITVAEIAKRCIAATATGDSGGKNAAGVWWQYTKVESSLIEWPPKKTKTKTEPAPRHEAEGRKEEEKQKEKSSREADVDALLNASKRRQSVVEERTAKKRKLDHPDTPPPQLDTSSDDRPPHLRDTSPAARSDSSIPPHLRDSSPAARSDSSIPPHLRDSSPVAGSDDSIPPHLRSSTPTPKPSPRPTAREGPPTTSSPPLMVVDELVESVDESAASQSDDSDNEDDYRDFRHMDLEHAPEKFTKQLLADLDEAERKRKKYRAIAVMTIYLSLQRRSDLEKLYGVQTNFEAKPKDG